MMPQNLNRLTGVTIVYNTLEWQGWSKVETLKCKRVVLKNSQQLESDPLTGRFFIHPLEPECPVRQPLHGTHCPA